ncbi:protein LURP-one-related 15 [Cajanus cajan]|uniref:protein LURP-one-related 15 n=1 Tax=Cajanus cajan TaxID=3821 RepID=UPI00098DC1A1|nr:protein LURP-one-related 15 [Cajanus cajan]
MENQWIPVIGPSYCAPYPLQLQINTEKGNTYDIKGDRVFHVQDTFFTLHHRRVLCDNSGNPIVTLYKEHMTMHGRCNVFRGKSSDPSQLVFSVKRSSMSSLIKLEVFLANNKKESHCDFRVIVGQAKSSCTVYVGESSNVAAAMVNNGGFHVWVNRYVDYAFVVALLLILHDMNDYADLKNLAIEIGKAVVLSDLSN